MRPLDDIVVLDLTRLLPGAYATLLLADLGADVIKIEDPRAEDLMRLKPPLENGVSVYHRALNRNKRSVTLDLRTADAHVVLDALAARADVVVESFRPRTARRLGVSADALRARHPHLVHCSITGFGQNGPYADRPGHDLNYIGLAGLLDVDRVTEDEPARPPRLLVADISGGAMNAVSGILAGLFTRARTGEGVAVDVSMFDGALAWLTFPAAHALALGAYQREQAPLCGREACYNVYRAADGRFLALGALEPKFWTVFCQRVGRPDLEPRQFTPDQPSLIGEVQRIIAARTSDDWLAHFADADTCLTRVNTVGEAIDDAHAAARGVIASGESGRHVRAPIHVELLRTLDGSATSRASHGPLPRAPYPPVTPAPAPGAHTDEVLESVGIHETERARLRAAGVI